MNLYSSLEYWGDIIMACLKKYLLTLLILTILTVAISSGCRNELEEGIKKIPELTEKEKEENIKLTERGVKYLVDPEKIISGGPPKDGIPSIDNPKYISVNKADKDIQDNELILGIDYKGVERAYPLQIMVWHEIVNDIIAGDPVLITY